MNPANAKPTADVHRRHAKGHEPWSDIVAKVVLFLAAASSVFITVAILFVLVKESSTFFQNVDIKTFLTDKEWMPTMASPRYGILPLLAGTLVTTALALCVALPIGTIVAIYLSEFARPWVRELVKPILELLSAVPTVVYGYFALLAVTPILQKIVPNVEGFNMLSAGLVMGIMIVPYVSSLSEDAMRAVPMILREGSYAMGASRLTTATSVVFPAALSGIGSAYVLGISRAIGETMIVKIAAGQQARLTLDPREGAGTVTAFIAATAQGDLQHGSIAYQSIFAAGITLFLMTLLFNVFGYILRIRFRQSY